MKDVSTGGRTVLFVSHNMGAVASLCGSVLHLREGKVFGFGSTQEQISTYLRKKDQGSLKVQGPLNESVTIQKIETRKTKGPNSDQLPQIEVLVYYEVKKQVRCFRPFLGISMMGMRICTWEGEPSSGDLETGVIKVVYKISASFLKNGIYSISAGAISKTKDNWAWVEDAETLEIYEHEINDPNQIREGIVYLPNHN